MKILLIDDSLLDRKLLVRILLKAGISQEILQAEDGDHAMEVLANNYRDICLILLDWQMPKVTGIELMAGMVKIPELSSIPTVMITASSSEENKRLAYQVNPKLAGYVVKPYKPEEIVATISPYLQ